MTKLTKYLFNEKWPEKASIVCKNLDDINILKTLNEKKSVAMILCIDILPDQQNKIMEYNLEKVRTTDWNVEQFANAGLMADIGIGFNCSVHDLGRCITRTIYQIDLDLSCKKFVVEKEKNK